MHSHFPAIFSQFGQRLVELAGIFSGARVLDVAAGHGVGIDIAEKMVEETTGEIQRKGLRNAIMLQMDGENLAFADASFDYVLCSFAIFFFSNLDRALSEFFRVVRPSGKLAVTLSAGNDELLNKYLATHNIPFTPIGGIGHPEPAAFRENLARIGFTDISSVAEEVDGIYADEQEWWLARWTHGARYPLEQMPPEVLDMFLSEVKERMAPLKQEDGYHERWRIQCVLAIKP